jgi:hypothetical protein
MKNNKVLLWTLAISGIVIAGFVAYKLMTPKKENKKVLSPEVIDKIGTFISGIFKPKQPEIYTSNTDYVSAPPPPLTPDDQWQSVPEDQSVYQ